MDSLSQLSALCERMGPTLWRQTSDVAQVVANYLRCHPHVQEVRYPGLKADPQFKEASQTLRGGFGPHLDYRVADEWHHLECSAQDPKDLIMELEKRLA